MAAAGNDFKNAVEVCECLWSCRSAAVDKLWSDFLVDWSEADFFLTLLCDTLNIDPIISTVLLTLAKFSLGSFPNNIRSLTSDGTLYLVSNYYLYYILMLYCDPWVVHSSSSSSSS